MGLGCIISDVQCAKN